LPRHNVTHDFGTLLASKVAHRWSASGQKRRSGAARPKSSRPVTADPGSISIFFWQISSTQEFEGLVYARVQIAMCRVDDKAIMVPIIVCTQSNCMPVGQGQPWDVA
jgi:hypothetical protein